MSILQVRVGGVAAVIAARGVCFGDLGAGVSARCGA
jgi:hypothetical protein